jgi:hypothetical protein
MALRRSRASLRDYPLSVYLKLICPNHRHIDPFADQLEPSLILPVAVRHKGIARSAVLHLTPAASARKRSLRFNAKKFA